MANMSFANENCGRSHALGFERHLLFERFEFDVMGLANGSGRGPIALLAFAIAIPYCVATALPILIEISEYPERADSRR